MSSNEVNMKEMLTCKDIMDSLFASLKPGTWDSEEDAILCQDKAILLFTHFFGATLALKIKTLPKKIIAAV